MRAVLQRVSEASVSVAGEQVGAIKQGWLVLLGIKATDTEKDMDLLIDKILNLRTFSDQDGKFNLSVSDIAGELLIVSQFTLYGDTRKGRRPSFSEAAPAELAQKLYQSFMSKLRSSTTLKVAEGVFQADMKVALINDGPVTLIVDSSKET